MNKKQNWRESKTYAKTYPHEYIVDTDNLELFNKITKKIEKKGVDKTWVDGKTYRYLVIGDYKYWRIDNILNRENMKIKEL